MNPCEMWARGRGDPKNVSSSFYVHPLCCCAKKKKEELGGGRGQEISGHHEEK